MNNLPHASTLVKKYSSGIAGVSLMDRNNMADAIETLDMRLAGGDPITCWFPVGGKYEFTENMVAHMKTLGYGMKKLSHIGCRTEQWYIRIEPDVETTST